MHPLIQHIQKITSHHEIEGDAILSVFETKTFKKKGIFYENYLTFQLKLSRRIPGLSMSVTIIVQVKNSYDPGQK